MATDAGPGEASAAKPASARNAWMQRLAVVAGLALVYAALLSRFDLKLLFSDTLLTGGDSASWYQVLEHLKNVFLPAGRLFGYTQSNFFGYMEGQQYFIPPFLFAALLGYVMPLTVALKIATMAGGLALPATAYLSARSFSGSRRIGLAAAGMAMLFLFNEFYTMFGGNWLSTFAGEFCYSWAIAALPLLLASIRRDERRGRSGVVSGLLLGFTGLCHLFVFMPAFFLPFYPVLRVLFRMARDRRKGKRGAGEGPAGAAIAAESAADAPGRAVARALTTYVVAFLLMAFWLLPMITTRSWAQSITMTWRFSGFREFARMTLIWVWAPCAIVLALMVARRVLSGRKAAGKARGVPKDDAAGGAGGDSGAVPTTVAREPAGPGRDDSPAGFLLYGLGACAFLYAISPGLGIPDIRFVPPALVICIFAVSTFAQALAARGGPFLERLRRAGPGKSRGPVFGSGQGGHATPGDELQPAAGKRAGLPAIAGWAATAAALAACIMLMLSGSRNAGGWFKWNYSGYEAKAQWQRLLGMAEELGGTEETGRLLWEKQNQADNADFGSERAFENLDYFTGRPSTEGINYGSSFMARASTYLQSAYSLNPVDPEPERIYSEVDPASWPVRFAQVNAKDIIVFSPKITSMFAAHPRFKPAGKFGKFSAFTSADFPGSYVQVLPAGRLQVVRAGPGGFRTDYYRFFRDYELAGTPFVSSRFSDRALESAVAASGGRTWQSYNEMRDVLAPVADASGAEAATESRAAASLASAGNISGEKVDDLSVSFVTDAPGAPHLLKMSWAPGWKSRNGERIYPVSPGFMLIFPKTANVELWYGRTAAEVAGLVLTLSLPLVAFLLARLAKRGMKPWRPAALLAGGVFALGLLGFPAYTFTGPSAIARDINWVRSVDLSNDTLRARAFPLVSKWATPYYLDKLDNMQVFDAYAFKASILKREGRGGEADAIIRMLKKRYPHCRPISRLPSTT